MGGVGDGGGHHIHFFPDSQDMHVDCTKKAEGDQQKRCRIPINKQHESCRVFMSRVVIFAGFVRNGPQPRITPTAPKN